MISVIVPVYNAARYLERVIEALRRQDYPPSAYELLLVDNGSDDESPQILERHPGIHVLSQPERGSYAARNRAIREARGDILAFTDADCYPEPGWLQAIEDAFRDEQTEVLLGPRLPGNERKSVGLVSDYENVKAEMMCDWHDPAVCYGYTNNMAVRRRTMERFGPFVHRPRGSDTIFVRRVVDALSCEALAYCREMRVQHAEMESVAMYYRKVMTYGRSPRAYRHIIASRPLTQAERLRVFMRASAHMGLAESVQLFLLLVGGAVAWWLGTLMGSEPG
jgi:glycosyltransferase involved in cell wall biosynthesis